MFKVLPDSVLTPRLTLRPWVLGDLEARTRLLADCRIAEYVGGGSQLPKKQESSLVTDIQMHAEGVAYRLAVCLRDSGILVGISSIQEVSFRDARVELVIAVAKEYRGHGYAPEASKYLVLAAFASNAGLQAIYGRVAMCNGSSKRLVRKLGMHRQDTLRERLHIFGERYYVLRRPAHGA